jgi:hypothetical protein
MATITSATVYHAQNTRDSMFYGDNDIYNAVTAFEAFKSGDYIEVAKFPVRNVVLDELKDILSGQLSQPAEIVDDLEQIYIATQNIHSPWCVPPKRSTSVGDIVKIDNTLWIVASCGFQFLTEI